MIDDRSYFARRFDEEAAAAVLAVDPRVAEVHATLAMHYRDRLRLTNPPLPPIFVQKPLPAFQ